MTGHHCKECQHYLQHYTFDKHKIFRVYCGHCTMDRVRRKRPDTQACEQFIPGTPQEEAFVSKEYLSKALLQYMFDLDLLPEIEEQE